jgi:hypothetical protein
VNYYSGSKDFLEEGDLSDDISLLNIFDLTLTDHIHRLIPLNPSSSRVERTKSESWICSPLDKTVILFNQIVQLLDLPQVRFLWHILLSLQGFEG